MSHQTSFKAQSAAFQQQQQKAGDSKKVGGNSQMMETHEKMQHERRRENQCGDNNVEYSSYEKVEQIDQVGKSAEEMERKAQELRDQAQQALKHNDQEFAEAQRAQALARAAAEQANIKTEKALQNQEKGQQILAEAGAQLIEAGSRLQREAAATQYQVPYNVHVQGEVRQTTCVSAPGVKAVAKAHECVTVREVEHFPPSQQQQQILQHQQQQWQQDQTTRIISDVGSNDQQKHSSQQQQQQQQLLEPSKSKDFQLESSQPKDDIESASREIHLPKPTSNISKKEWETFMHQPNLSESDLNPSNGCRQIELEYIDPNPTDIKNVLVALASFNWKMAKMIPSQKSTGTYKLKFTSPIPECYFKFVVNDQWMTSDKYNVATDEKGNQNNYI